MKWCTVLLLLAPSLLGAVWCAGGPSNPMDLMRLAGLLGCRLNGKDKGIDTEFARSLLGFASPTKVQQCMLGCVIGWAHSANFLVQFETGMELLPQLPGQWLGELSGTLKKCVSSALSKQKKCSIASELVKCLITTEQSNIITRFKNRYMSWLPCWDFLKGKVPVVKQVDKVANNLKDKFIQQVLGVVKVTVDKVQNLPLSDDDTQTTAKQQSEATAEQQSEATTEQPEATTEQQPEATVALQPEATAWTNMTLV